MTIITTITITTIITTTMTITTIMVMTMTTIMAMIIIMTMTAIMTMTVAIITRVMTNAWMEQYQPHEHACCLSNPQSIPSPIAFAFGKFCDEMFGS